MGPPLRTEGEGLQGRESSGGLAACGAEWPRPFPTSRTILLFRRRGGPNANRLRVLGKIAKNWGPFLLKKPLDKMEKTQKLKWNFRF